MCKMEDKYDLLDQVYADKDVKKTAKAIFQYLIYLSNKTNCFPAVSTIAKALNRSVRCIQYNMRQLEQKGYIVRKTRFYNHNQLTNQYDFNLGVIEPDKSKRPEEELMIYNTFFSNQGERRYRKVELMKYIYASNSIHKSDRALLIYIVSKANKKGIAYGCINDICCSLHISLKMINSTIDRLVSDGYITIAKCSNYIGFRINIRRFKGAFAKSSINLPEDKNTNDFEQIDKRNSDAMDSYVTDEKLAREDKDIFQDTSNIYNSKYNWPTHMLTRIRSGINAAVVSLRHKVDIIIGIFKDSG